MTESLLERIQSGYNKIEELAKDLPGYKGYKDKEVRREADKLVRLKVARGFEEQRRRLNGVVVKLVSAGRLRLVMTLDRALMRMDLLVDRLKLASYGYAGLFDAIKIREPELDALYNFDAALVDSVARVQGLVDAVASAEGDDAVTQAGDELLAALDEINETFGKRQDAFLESSSV
jgi:hypothetical protein